MSSADSEGQAAVHIGRRDRLSRHETFLDLESLSHAFSFLGQFDGLTSRDARQLRLYFDELLDLELELLPSSAYSDSLEFENQYEFDNWIMAVASLRYATLPLPEALQSVANPIMSLGVGAHNSIKDFLQAFFRYAPQLCETSRDLADRWNALIQISFDPQRWNYEETELNTTSYILPARSWDFPDIHRELLIKLSTGPCNCSTAR